MEVKISELLADMMEDTCDGSANTGIETFGGIDVDGIANIFTIR